MNDNTINNDLTMGGAAATLLAGRYRVVRQLGQGGMGSVWLAEDMKLDGFKVAIKMLPSVLVNNKRAYQQVKAEALVSLKLVHPNIVQVRAFEEEGGNPFLVMDYIDGQTLDDYLAEKGKLTEEETVKLLKPVAAALDYAHTQGVVHRDVKPGNIMIRKDGTPFVLDFGIAREIQETMTRVTGKLSSGTLLYMSPEQLNGDAPKPAQDIYSLAAMAYECLKGEPPFTRGGIEDQIKHKAPEPLAPQFIKCGPSVMAGLEKAHEVRPATCAAVLGEGTRISRDRTGSGESTVMLRISAAWFGALLLMAALAGVLVILCRQTALNEVDDQEMNVPDKRRLSPVSIDGSLPSVSVSAISNAVGKTTENLVSALQVQEQLKFYLQRADFVHAKPVAEKVLSNDAEDPAANFALGMFYIGSDVSKAEKYLTAVLTRKPKEIAVLNNLAMLQIRQKRFKEAADNLNKALELAPGHKAILDTLNQLKTAECNEESIRQVKDDTERNAAKKREREANRDDQDRQTVNLESIKQVEQARSLKAGDTKTISLPGGVEMEMVWCPPGSFRMGSPDVEEGRFVNELQHYVTLTEGFWMGKYEVTQAQWKSVMGMGGSHIRFTGDDRPAEPVSWDDCQDFLKKAGGGLRLPTDAEWEYACRAGSTTLFAGTGRLDEMGWYSGNSGGGTHPVGMKHPNAWGLYDMHGNVQEWCQDWLANSPKNDVENPQGPLLGEFRIVRGGCCNAFARFCRSASRLGQKPFIRNDNMGFRIACPDDGLREGSAVRDVFSENLTKADMPPKSLVPIRPDYPKSSRSRGEEGDVVLSIRVAATGVAERVDVAVSSGFPDLDNAAVDAARAARFAPAKKGGKPIASIARLKLSFKLK